MKPSPSPTAVSSSDHTGPLLSSIDQFQDSSLFETTSISAARALAIQHLKDAFPNLNQSELDLLDHQSLLDSDLIIQSSERDWNGKPVYQVRPNPIQFVTKLSSLINIDKHNHNTATTEKTHSPSSPSHLTLIDSNDYNVNIIALASPESDRTPTTTQHSNSINPTLDSPYSSPTPKIIRSYKSTPQLLLFSLSSSQSTPALVESTQPNQSTFIPVTISPDQMGFYSSPNHNLPSPSQSNHHQSNPFIPDRSLRGSVSDMKLRNKLDQQQKQSLSKQAYTSKHTQAFHSATSSAHPFSKEALRDADVLGKILGWRTSTAFRNNHARQNITLPMKSNFSSSNLPATMKTTTKNRSNTTTTGNYNITTSDFDSFHPHAASSQTEPLPITLLASPASSYHPKLDNQELTTNTKGSFGENSITPEFPPLNRSQTQRRVPKPSLKPIVPFGNGVKLYRNHTTTPTPSVTRSIKKSLSSDDLHRLRKDSISASWNPTRQPVDRPSLSYAPHTTPPPNPTFLLRSPDDTTPTSALHRTSLPVHFQMNLDLESASRGTLSAAKRRRTMHGVASNESIRTARPSPQQRKPESSYPFPAFRKPRFQDISIFDTFNQSAIPSYSNLPSPVESNSPLANSLRAGRDQIGGVNTAAHQITVIAQPGDDPRYVIWGEQQDSNKSSVPVTKKRSSSIVERQQTHQSSTSSTSNLTHIGNGNSSKSSDVGGVGSSVYNVRRWSRPARHQAPGSSTPMGSTTSSFGNSSTCVLNEGSQSSHPMSSNSNLTEEGNQNLAKRSSLGSRGVPIPTLQRILMAATIERWVAELTTRIDPRALGDFFFTYRNVMKPIDLCMLLTSRFEWTILFKCRKMSTSSEDDKDDCLNIWGRKILIDAQEEAGRRIVKVRTFVMIRHWLLNHFEDDFLQDRALRFRLTSWLKNLIQKIKSIRQCLIEIDPKTNSKGDEDLKILKSLKKVVKERKDVYLAYNLVSDNNDKNRSKHRDVRDVFGQGDSEKKSGWAQDGNFAKSDLRLNDGDASEDQATDDEDVEVDVKPEDNELSDSNSIQARYEKLKETFAQDTHDISELESNTTDEANVKFDRAPLFISRKSTAINATLSHVPTHSITNSSDTLDHRINHVRPIDPLGFTQQHNPIQRYFTSTMGTFGRFKRMINNRSGTAATIGPYSSMTDSSRFNDHVESNGEVCDLLCAKGGLERFMSFFEGDNRLEHGGQERLEEIAEDKESIYSRRFETEDCPPISGKTNSEIERMSMEDVGKCSMEIEKTSSEIDRGHLSSPLIQDDEDGFESQLSLSSSTSNTSCTTSSQPYSSDEKRTDGLVASVGSKAIEFLDTETSSLALSFGMVQDEKDGIDARKFGSRPQSLHESLSTETIKSESNRTSKGVGAGLFKKQIKKRFANPNLGSMRLLGFESRQSLGLDQISMSMNRDSMTLDRSSLSVDRGNESSTSRDNLSLRSGRSGTGPQDISVQLDDLDLSDQDGSDSDQPHENHRPLRRLKAAGDLKEAITSTRRSFFAQLKPSLRLRVNSGVRLSTETSSSIGTRRVPSIAGSIFRRSKLGNSVNSLPDTLNSHQNGTEAEGEEEDEEDEAGGIGVVANFVAEGLDSDEDEPGDVEAALRRLEGVIDADREKEKARKVERQMMKSLEASRTGNRSRSSTIDSHRTFSSSASSLAVVTDEEEEEEEEVEQEDGEAEQDEEEMEMLSGQDDLAVDKASTPTIPEITFDHVAERDSKIQEGHRSSEEKSSRPKFMNSSKESIVDSNGVGGNDLWKRKHKPLTAIELNGNQQAMDRKLALHKRFVGGGALSRPMSLFGGAGGAQPPIHRSFLLDFRTEILAQQFALIERDLLRKISWQELLMSRWQDNGGIGSSNDSNCWTSYMKQRVIEGKSKSDNVRSLIVRFNLTCNWVASELVMTVGLEERVRLLGKLIRLAFKCYRQNNFQTLTQIIHGLQTPYITRLKRTWAKLGIWESRMFRNLKEFTSHGANFKSLRLVQDQLVEGIESVGGPTGRATATGGLDERVGDVGCIPFLGLYLRDLTINDELPTYLNPNEPSIGLPTIDPETGFVEGTNLYPLVNIHKFRIYSKVVNKILGFQELSLSYPFEAQGDQSLFLNCLRLKSLDSSKLRWLSDVCEG